MDTWFPGNADAHLGSRHAPHCLSLVLPFSQVSIYEVDKQDCRKFCTTGIDGAMTIWDFKVLSVPLRTHLIGA